MSLAIFIGRVNEMLSLVGSTAFRASLAVLATFPVASAHAVECRQGSAVYSDRDGAYELRFTPINSESAAASNQFQLKILKTSIVLDGYIMASEDPERAVGILMFDCPGGDVTGDDLDACTIWQGAVYGMDAAGELDNLQPEAAAAAGRIILPGLGPAIRSSSIWGSGKAEIAPWDVLAFKECGK